MADRPTFVLACQGRYGNATALSFMALSGYFLWLAQQNIPIGTAYAIWTGIGLWRLSQPITTLSIIKYEIYKKDSTAI